MKSLFSSEKRQEPSVHYQMNQGGGHGASRHTLIIPPSKKSICLLFIIPQIILINQQPPSPQLKNTLNLLLATCLCNQAGALVGRLNQYPFHRHHSHHFWTSFHFISGTSRFSRQTSLSYVTIRTRNPQNWLDAQITCASCSGEKNVDSMAAPHQKLVSFSLTQHNIISNSPYKCRRQRQSMEGEASL